MSPSTSLSNARSVVVLPGPLTDGVLLVAGKLASSSDATRDPSFRPCELVDALMVAAELTKAVLKSKKYA